MPLGKIEELKKIIALQGLPEEQLRWILEHADYREYEDREILTATGKPIEHLWFISEGRVQFYLDVKGALVKYYTFENTQQTGGSGGLLPYSRMIASPGYSYAEGKVNVFAIHKSLFHELERVSPELIQRLVGYMTERARTFATLKLQQEKVGALGQLAAGIAHELNNPASAISRIAEELNSKLRLNYELTEKMIEHRVNPGHVRAIFEVAQQKEAAPRGKLTAMQRIQREDEIADWLREKGYEGNLLSNDVFVESGFTVNDFETIRTSTGDKEFAHLAQWLENLLVSRELIKDLGIASGRISQLVGAVKSHVRMDSTSEKQPTNIHSDIDNTLTLLGYKLRQKNIKVEKKYCNNMHNVPAVAGELNQVWTNIIDNAIYAMGNNGTLTIETVCSKKEVTACIIDNGTGIPKEIISRIFDPFFTTKKVGEGTGIGLNLVSRIIKSHNGEISVTSEPGKTAFSIRLPFEDETGSKSANETHKQ